MKIFEYLMRKRLFGDRLNAMEEQVGGKHAENRYQTA